MSLPLDPTGGLLDPRPFASPPLRTFRIRHMAVNVHVTILLSRYKQLARKRSGRLTNSSNNGSVLLTGANKSQCVIYAPVDPTHVAYPCARAGVLALLEYRAPLHAPSSAQCRHTQTGDRNPTTHYNQYCINRSSTVASTREFSTPSPWGLMLPTQSNTPAFFPDL